MSFLYSNGPEKDFVVTPYQKQLAKCKSVFVASPYVTMTGELVNAAKDGKQVSLLVGLNSATSANALRAAFGVPNLAIRYFTYRFHAKVYLFDDCALVGSSNLTDSGMHTNREATVFLERTDEVASIRALCQELWTSAEVLTPIVLKSFEMVKASMSNMFDPDAKIEAAIGKVQPTTITVGSQKKSSEYIFLQALRRRVYEKFKPAFDLTSQVLSENDLHRSEWSSEDRGSETNRFLNWVRLTYGAGDDWRKSPIRTSSSDIAGELIALGREWAKTPEPRITHDYFTNMEHLRRVFRNVESLTSASREDLSQALMGVHAFEEQIRFIRGGYSAIIDFFWQQNEQDLTRVKRSLRHLLFDTGDFIQRLYEVLYFPEWKIRYFGESCALELTGTVQPETCPPMNGRSAKGLRYIGFDVPAS